MEVLAGRQSNPNFPFKSERVSSTFEAVEFKRTKPLASCPDPRVRIKLHRDLCVLNWVSVIAGNGSSNSGGTVNQLKCYVAIVA